MHIDCENCGRQVYRNKARIDKQKHHFCSSKCFHEYRSKNHYGVMEIGTKTDKRAMRKIKELALQKKSISRQYYGL